MFLIVVLPRIKSPKEKLTLSRRYNITSDLIGESEQCHQTAIPLIGHISSKQLLFQNMLVVPPSSGILHQEKPSKKCLQDIVISDMSKADAEQRQKLCILKKLALEIARNTECRYTDGLRDIDPDQAEEMFDAASRYFLFPLKRAVAEVLLPQLEMVSPGELCHWLQLSDMYGVGKIREYCLDTTACNFEAFADTREFRAMLLTLPPPSGDSSLTTTTPSAPGSGGVANSDQGGNILDDLSEKWLEVEAAELDKRDESALLFDKRLEMLLLVAQKEKSGSGDEAWECSV